MRRTLLFLPLLFIFGCSPPNAGAPPVDTERLTDLVADLHLMEALAGDIPVILQDSMKQVFYANILADHGYRRAEFDSLLWIVRSEPEWIDAFYQEVSAKVATMEAEMSRVPPKLEQE